MSVNMRAKMVVDNIVSNGATETISYRAIHKSEGYGPDGKDENNSFATWTPSAHLSMCVTNPDIIGKLKVGDTFYLDFTPVMVVQRNPQ